MFPPSPKNACVKSPEFRTKVWSPSPNSAIWMVTPAHADSTTFWRLYGRPRRSSMRSVSRDRLLSVVSPAVSQKRGPNSEAGVYAESARVRRLFLRRGAPPPDGEELVRGRGGEGRGENEA